MNSALSPREIQARLRAGASVPEVAAEAGVEVGRIEGFALPVMAERAHMTRTALGASVRRRGDGSGHRRLGELIRERLQARGLDADTVRWDAWRQNDLKWRLQGLLEDHAASRTAEFVFDPKGKFSIADNADARWMIGEASPGPRTEPDDEKTINFSDELALFRAMSDEPASGVTGRPGDEVPPHEAQYEGAAHTSELDELYDMLSGVSEDSVRIYLGLDDADDAATDQDSSRDESGSGGSESTEARPTDAPVSADMEESEATLADELSEHPEHDGALHTDLENNNMDSSGPDEQVAGNGNPAGEAPAHVSVLEDRGSSPDPAPATPEQDPLVPDEAPSAPKRKPARKRASIPSWDEIMFGGPPRG